MRGPGGTMEMFSWLNFTGKTKFPGKVGLPSKDSIFTVFQYYTNLEIFDTCSKFGGCLLEVTRPL